MGPRLASRGLHRRAGGTNGGSRGFNGSTAREPWSTGRRPPRSTRPTSLQWVHGSRAVVYIRYTLGWQIDTGLQWVHGSRAVVYGEKLDARQSVIGASMGPRLASRGLHKSM